MKSFLVLGAGRFGESLAKSLYQTGCEVMVLDMDEKRVQEISPCVTHAMIGDCTDEEVLNSLGVCNFDSVIVSIGGDLQSSIIATLILKDAGVKNVLAKAQSELHAKVLKKVGADKVVLPERDMGTRVAHLLTSKHFLDLIELSPEYSIVEITVPENWVGRRLGEIDVRKKYGINIVAVKNQDNSIKISPAADTTFNKDDTLVVIGGIEAIDRL
jgi:trk system potassium uptake protein TrkA